MGRYPSARIFPIQQRRDPDLTLEERERYTRFSREEKASETQEAQSSDDDETSEGAWEQQQREWMDHASDLPSEAARRQNLGNLGNPHASEAEYADEEIGGDKDPMLDTQYGALSDNDESDNDNNEEENVHPLVEAILDELVEWDCDNYDLIFNALVDIIRTRGKTSVDVENNGVHEWTSDEYKRMIKNCLRISSLLGDASWVGKLKVEAEEEDVGFSPAREDAYRSDNSECCYSPRNDESDDESSSDKSDYGYLLEDNNESDDDCGYLLEDNNGSDNDCMPSY